MRKVYKKYIDELTALHKILVNAMKAKQTLDMKNIRNLRKFLNEFNKIYFGEAQEGGSYDDRAQHK